MFYLLSLCASAVFRGWFYTCHGSLWRSEDSSVKSIFFFYIFFGSGDQTQVVRLTLQTFFTESTQKPFVFVFFFLFKIIIIKTFKSPIINVRFPFFRNCLGTFCFYSYILAIYLLQTLTTLDFALV